MSDYPGNQGLSLPTPYYEKNGIVIYNSDALTCLRELPDESVNSCVTSPPYWGLRDYGSCSCGSGRFDMGQGEGTGGNLNYRAAKGFDPVCKKCNGTGRVVGTENQLGLESTPAEYVEKMVAVFREVRRVLRDGGTLWLNLGDSYGAVGGDTHSGFNARYFGKESIVDKQSGQGASAVAAGNRAASTGLRPKNLVGIPWRVAFALQSDGWYLRQDIIWAKPNPMPESVRDRCTKAHEYIFLLSKSAKYYFDADAIAEPASTDENRPNGIVRDRIYGYNSKQAALHDRTPVDLREGDDPLDEYDDTPTTRNKRSVWTVTTKPYKEAHFAVFPPEIPRRCILAGCPLNGVVLDPFAGSGTTLMVAQSLERKSIGIELNPAYIEMAAKRLAQDVFDFGVKE